jgi:hypothetical protein
MADLQICNLNKKLAVFFNSLALECRNDPDYQNVLNALEPYIYKEGDNFKPRPTPNTQHPTPNTQHPTLNGNATFQELSKELVSEIVKSMNPMELARFRTVFEVDDPRNPIGNKFSTLFKTMFNGILKAEKMYKNEVIENDPDFWPGSGSLLFIDCFDDAEKATKIHSYTIQRFHDPKSNGKKQEWHLIIKDPSDPTKPKPIIYNNDQDFVNVLIKSIHVVEGSSKSTFDLLDITSNKRIYMCGTFGNLTIKPRFDPPPNQAYISIKLSLHYNIKFEDKEIAIKGICQELYNKNIIGYTMEDPAYDPKIRDSIITDLSYDPKIRNKMKQDKDKTDCKPWTNTRITVGASRASYKKTIKKYVGKDGVSRRIYAKGRSQYIKRRNPDGTFRYTTIRANK